MVSGIGNWRGRRVFLTGHTGFKGSWLAMLLADQGAEIFGYALPPIEGGVYQAARVVEKIAVSTYADVRDLAALSAALTESRADVVIHMAAQPLVRLSYDDPVGTYATNVMGTVHLLEAVRHTTSVRSCVIVTSDKCYQNNEWLWGYRENEPMGGHDPYSNSKGCSELVTDAFRSSYFKKGDSARIASGRAGNVIGGGDWSRDRLVPDLVRTFAESGTVAIRSPNAVRPWQHVLDPVIGYAILADSLIERPDQDFAGGWNFGPNADAERTVEDVVETVRSVWGEPTTWSKDKRPHPHEAGYLKLDSSKARRLLGWQPVWDFERAITETVSWYRANDAGQDMRKYTTDQIETYLNDLGAIAGAN